MSEATWWGAAVSGSAEVRPFRFSGAERGWRSHAHSRTHTHQQRNKTCAQIHMRTQVKSCFDRAAVRTGQLRSSDSTGHCLINTHKNTLKHDKFKSDGT